MEPYVGPITPTQCGYISREEEARVGAKSTTKRGPRIPPLPPARHAPVHDVDDSGVLPKPPCILCSSAYGMGTSYNMLRQFGSELAGFRLLVSCSIQDDEPSPKRLRLEIHSATKVANSGVCVIPATLNMVSMCDLTLNMVSVKHVMTCPLT